MLMSGLWQIPARESEVERLSYALKILPRLIVSNSLRLIGFRGMLARNYRTPVTVMAWPFGRHGVNHFYISERGAKSFGLCILVFCVAQRRTQRLILLNAPKRVRS